MQHTSLFVAIIDDYCNPVTKTLCRAIFRNLHFARMLRLVNNPRRFSWQFHHKIFQVSIFLEIYVVMVGISKRTDIYVNSCSYGGVRGRVYSSVKYYNDYFMTT